MEARERFGEKKIVRDLDAILQSPGSIKLHGKLHEIKPVSVGEYFQFANALLETQNLQREEQISIAQFVDAILHVVMPICPTITREDIRACSQAQIAALVDTINAHIMGGLTDEKKKKLMAGSLN